SGASVSRGAGNREPRAGGGWADLPRIGNRPGEIPRREKRRHLPRIGNAGDFWGAARPHGGSGRLDSLIDFIVVEDHVRRALGEVLWVVSLFDGDQPLGLLLAFRFHLDCP